MIAINSTARHAEPLLSACFWLKYVILYHQIAARFTEYSYSLYYSTNVCYIQRIFSATVN